MSEHNFSRRNIERPVEELEPPVKEVVGIVTGCRLLNIRTKPDADSHVICRETALSELIIDESKSTEDWFSVCTVNGIEGFCMKQFVTIKP